MFKYWNKGKGRKTRPPVSRLVDVYRTETANKKRWFKTVCEDSVDMSRTSHARGEICNENWS